MTALRFLLKVHREILTFFHCSGRSPVAKFAVEHVDFSRGELSGGHTGLKQVVEFGERSASWFRNSEVGVDDAEEAGTTALAERSARKLSVGGAADLRPEEGSLL